MSLKILIPGIAIVLAGFALLSSRGLQISQVQLASIIETSRNSYTIELDAPSYFPPDYKQAKKFFSGREIVIKKKTGDRKIILKNQEITFANRDKTTNNLRSTYKAPVNKQKEVSFVVEIPDKFSSGYYTLEFEDSQRIVLLPLDIEGFPPAGADGGVVLPSAPVAPSVTIRKIGCFSCYWELVSAINPLNENYGYLAGGTIGSGYHSAQSIDGWNTSAFTSIDARVSPLLRNFRADPKFAFTTDNKISLTGVIMDASGDPTKNTSGGLYTEKQTNSYPLLLAQKIIKSVSNPTPGSYYFDYPKLAIDTNLRSPYKGNTYVVVNQILPPNDRSTTGLFIIDPAGNVAEKQIGIEWYFPQSIKIGPAGEIYVAISDLNSNPHTSRLLTSRDGGNTFTENVIGIRNAPCSAARVSTQSGRSLYIYAGPELAIGTGPKAKLYAAWAAPRECVFNDPTFELSRYGRDFDVYVNYLSEDVWSTPVRVNNDDSGGDQAFPSITVGLDNTVYVAFIDHREHQDQPVFDVYLAKSFDLGNTFPASIRVNDTSVPARFGGRAFGDYLDMVSVGKNKSYIAYPCVNFTFDTPLRPATDFPTDACVSIISDVEPPTVPENLSAVPLSPSQVKLSWSPSLDNLNKIAYRIYRNGAIIAGTVRTSYTDGVFSPLQPNTKYTYTITAYDSSPARNQSALSAQVMATTLPRLLDSIPLSITPIRTTINSEESVTLIFGVPESTFRLQFFLSCPVGLSAKPQSGNEVCNAWQDLPLATRQYTLSFVNNGTDILRAVPNFYAYYASNPNFANGVSGEIAVQPY